MRFLLSFELEADSVMYHFHLDTHARGVVERTEEEGHLLFSYQTCLLIPCFSRLYNPRL